MEDNCCKGALIIGKGMAVTPDSDCNSNLHQTGSVLSNTSSSQDIDFIQDNSDYQWFLDYGYRDNNHTSILSLPESYEANDIGYYDALAKNMDANLAEVDIESFRTEDIHALLTNLPPMCTDQMSQDSHRQGESFASVTGSMMGKFDFDSSSPHSSSQTDGDDSTTSMSICKSELLFSPVKETPMLPSGVNFSVDSLDCDLFNEHDIMLTCQANKDNYTIAFEGSITMYSEDDSTDAAAAVAATTTTPPHWPLQLKKSYLKQLKAKEASMTQSDSGSLTTWSKLKKRSIENPLRRHPSGNNNDSSADDLTTHSLCDTMKSQSMPNLLHKQMLRNLMVSGRQSNMSNSSADCCTIKRRPVKVFDIQHQQANLSSESGGSLVSDMTTSIDGASSSCGGSGGGGGIGGSGGDKPNFNLVKLFMKQKSISAEGMSTGLDQSSASENWPESGCDSHISTTQQQQQQKRNFEEDSLVDAKETKEQQQCNNNGSYIIMDDLLKRKLHSRSMMMHQNRRQTTTSSSSTASSSSLLLETTTTKSNRKIAAAAMHLMNKSIQTSTTIAASTTASATTTDKPYKLHCHNVMENKENMIRIVDTSFLKKLKEECEIPKPVYVLYPNYVLPNLDFLEDRADPKVILMPQRVTPTSQRKTNKQQQQQQQRRPFSCNDVEALKRKGFSHVQDWESLNVLLPNECKEYLADIPEVASHLKKQQQQQQTNEGGGGGGVLLERSTSSGYRGSFASDSPNNNPLFVYRYDSATSSDASLHTFAAAPPLPKRSTSVVPPRPPLPRSILRKGADAAKKRYSMFEPNSEQERLLLKRCHLVNDGSSSRIHQHTIGQQQDLVQQQQQQQRPKRHSETEDEGVDAGTSSSSLETNDFRSQSPLLKHDVLFANISHDELMQLEEFLKMSGISSDSDDINEESILQLRSYVSKFLTLKINQDPNRKCVSFAEKAPNNSPNVSALLNQRQYQSKALVDQPICEEGESTPPPDYQSPQHAANNKPIKNQLLTDVGDAVERMIQNFAMATNQMELNDLGDSQANPKCAKIALTYLCPALYAILSDGLKPNLETSFGAIGNSVWQVVEASAQQGPLTKALNELVMRINGDDVITEGLVKFNAFVFGLLNVRSLDAWFSYLRTRESILKKHYSADALLLVSYTGGLTLREIYDNLIQSLQPLALFPFQIDLLFEYRQLHESLKRMDSYHQPPSPKHHHERCLSADDFDASSTRALLHSRNERPRSCVDPGILSKPSFKLGEDVNSVAKKRWSGINFTSKLFAAYSRLGQDASQEEEEYTDSLETAPPPPLHHEAGGGGGGGGPESLDSNLSDDKPLNGRKFKKLQKRWEMLSAKEQSPPESPTHKSKIPRPVASPVRPSGIPVPISPTTTTSSSSNSRTGTVIRKVITPPGPPKKTPIGGVSSSKNLVKNSPQKKNTFGGTRPSRLDQLENGQDVRNVIRPSSLPYKPYTTTNKTNKITPPRRAISTSVNRKPTQTTTTTIPKVKTVRTLSHRLPSESGHLSFNEGERLKVVLEVDDRWLLCCRGSEKGLVPRYSVIPDSNRF